MQTISGKIIVVTGGSGFVGSRVAARLAAEGAIVRAIVRSIGEHPGLESEGIEQIAGSFVEPAVAERACEGADDVVHCAATATGEVAAVRRVNATGTANLAAAARAARCRRFVHISTVAVYAILDPGANIDEETPLKTEGDNYGMTKAEAERALHEETARGLAAVVLRPGAILGAHPTSYWAVKIPTLIRDGKLPLLGDGASLFPWVHVEDVVDAVVHALGDPRAVGRAYNLVDGHWVWRDFVGEVRSWFPGAPPPPVILREKLDPARHGHYLTGRHLADRIRSELGYRPRHTYADGMAEAAAWWRERGARASR